jgi:hypothetical protein
VEYSIAAMITANMATPVAAFHPTYGVGVPNAMGTTGLKDVVTDL